MMDNQMKRHAMRPGARFSRGVSLIEVLVALFITVIGIMGAVTMQSTSLKGNRSAYFRTQANYIAADMASRMRVNPTGVAANAYNNISTSSAPADPNCVSTGCNASQLALQDQREWAHYFTNVFAVTAYRPTLPQGSGTVVGDGTSFVITVNWTESAQVRSSARSYTLNLRL
jgi:type IV pilus assembly protein PilV